MFLQSVIKLLELIHKLMPHVAAMNLLVPSTEDFITTTTNYYTWVESEHPYKQATVTNSRFVNLMIIVVSVKMLLRKSIFWSA